jgi:hypothetical protein
LGIESATRFHYKREHPTPKGNNGVDGVKGNFEQKDDSASWDDIDEWWGTNRMYLPPGNYKNVHSVIGKED